MWVKCKLAYEVQIGIWIPSVFGLMLVTVGLQPRGCAHLWLKVAWSPASCNCTSIAITHLAFGFGEVHICGQKTFGFSLEDVHICSQKIFGLWTCGSATPWLKGHSDFSLVEVHTWGQKARGDIVPLGPKCALQLNTLHHEAKGIVSYDHWCAYS